MSVPAYPSYRDSGVAWLGKVPSHWEVSPIKRLGSIRYGIGEPPPYRDEGVPLIRATNVDHGKISLAGLVNIDPADIPGNRAVWLADGDIVVVRSGAYTGDSALISNEVLPAIAGFDMVLRPFGCEPAFLSFALLSSYLKEGQIDLERMRAAQPHLNAEELGACLVTFPPRAEQASIAAFLDRETAKIDVLVEEQRRLVELLKEKRQAVISHAVTKGLDPTVPMKNSGVDWLGEVPAHWDVVPVNYKYQVQLGRMLNEERASGPNLRPYLRVFDVQWGEINIDDLPLMDFPPDAQEAYRLVPGDLMVNEGGSYVGRSAIWRGGLAECYYQKALHRLRVHDAAADTAEFFFYVMDFATKRGVFIAGGNQTTIDHLTADQFRKYRFAFPPLQEQVEIARHLADRTTQFEALTSEAEAAIALLQERRSALISAAVTGKIDVRGLVARETEAA